MQGDFELTPKLMRSGINYSMNTVLEAERVHPTRITRQREAIALEPFNNKRLIMWTRMYATAFGPDNIATGSRPFSTRIIGKYGVERITVTGVEMPAREDRDGEPILRYMPAERYADLADCLTLRSKISEGLAKLDLHTLREIYEGLVSLL